MDNPSPRHAANPTQQNIDAIAKLEHEALGRRTITERVSEVITSIVGNMGFLLAQLILISGWILVNLHAIPGLKAQGRRLFSVSESRELDLGWSSCCHRTNECGQFTRRGAIADKNTAT
jgi:hypothetical protein